MILDYGLIFKIFSHFEKFLYQNKADILPLLHLNVIA